MSDLNFHSTKSVMAAYLPVKELIAIHRRIGQPGDVMRRIKPSFQTSMSPFAVVENNNFGSLANKVIS